MGFGILTIFASSANSCQISEIPGHCGGSEEERCWQEIPGSEADHGEGLW